RRGGVLVDLAGVRDLGPLPKESEVALFRVAQEALANVARHAGTDRAALVLKTRSGAVVLRVIDLGRGIARGSGTQRVPLGVGIAGMRERLRQLGGDLDIASDTGGTVVTARLPFAWNDDQA